MSELAKRCRAMVTGNEQYTMAEWQDTLLKAANLIEKQDRLIALQKEYVEFLTGILNKHSGFLAAHRCFDNQEEIDEGKRLRDEIKQMEETL